MVWWTERKIGILRVKTGRLREMYCIGSVEVFMVWCTKRKVGILRAKTGGQWTERKVLDRKCGSIYGLVD